MDSAQLRDEDLFLITNVYPEDTGLPFVIYVSQQQGVHDVRVKIGSATRPLPIVASVSVRPGVELLTGTLSNSDLDLVRQWIDLNRDVIIAHWEGDMPSSRHVLNALKPLPQT